MDRVYIQSLRRDLAILLNIKGVIGLQDGDFVVWNLGTVNHNIKKSSLLTSFWVHSLRETFDHLKLSRDLTALLGYLFLCPITAI